MAAKAINHWVRFWKLVPDVYPTLAIGRLDYWIQNIEIDSVIKHVGRGRPGTVGLDRDKNALFVLDIYHFDFERISVDSDVTHKKRKLTTL
jgi:hypothetical protein